MKQLTTKQFLSKFGSEACERIQELVAKGGVAHIVLFENQMFGSSQFGSRTAMIVGPDCTYKELSDVEGRWLNDLPSQRQYPVAFTVTDEGRKGNEKEEIEPAGRGGPGSGS